VAAGWQQRHQTLRSCAWGTGSLRLPQLSLAREHTSEMATSTQGLRGTHTIHCHSHLLDGFCLQSYLHSGANPVVFCQLPSRSLIVLLLTHLHRDWWVTSSQCSNTPSAHASSRLTHLRTRPAHPYTSLTSITRLCTYTRVRAALVSLDGVC
jgi:hypothetical protein